YKVMKNWGVIGGIAAALAAGIYVIWGPITERKKRRKALSCQEVTEDEVLDASCLLDVLRMYRWQISSFEEQPEQLTDWLTQRLCEPTERASYLLALLPDRPELVPERLCHWLMDAHELFHVITSSLEDERDRQPRVTHLFDVHSLEGHPLTLDHCLHHFISSESVRDVVCDNCTKTYAVTFLQIEAKGTLNGEKVEHQRTTFVKQLKLGKLPQCLCIHLQRLSWSSHGTPLKRHEHVQFNEFLMMDFYKYRLLGHKPSQHGPKASENLGSALELQDTQAALKPGLSQPGAKTQIFMNGACSPSLLPALPSPLAFSLPVVPDYSSSTYLFRLMAVVVHHGDMHSGHFVTYRRSPPSAKNPLSTSNQWLWISDDTVRKASLQEVLSSSAYLLFYERVLSRAQQQGREYRAEE
ncbi:Ubiquitin carboxyl-terminal hydrolase 30, partial [Microtus ochrogaster]